MRVCAVNLPELRVELAKEPEPTSAPLAVVVAPPPLTEAKLLGSTRLSVVSREARALGVSPGQTVAQARARAGDLAVRVVRPDAVREVLARVAEVGLAFGATVSFGMAGEPQGSSRRASAPGSSGDVVWIDVTGCAHLHARSGADALFDGETILASRLAGAIASLGHTCSVAIADGPRVAAMLALSRAEAALRESGALGGRPRRRGLGGLAMLQPLVVRSGESAAAIAPLPVSALPLAPEEIRWLAKVGVRTIAELRALPRPELAARLGARARDVLALMSGDDRAPLAAYTPPEIPEEQLSLEYGVEGTQALTFVAKALTDRLAARLSGRAVSAARVELELHLDRAMLEEVRSEDPSHAAVDLVTLDLPAPLSSAGDLLAALRPKIERLTLRAPVLTLKLRAPVLVHTAAAALSLFEPQPKAERALPRLVAELVSDLGPEAVCSLVLGDGWLPEARSRLVPFQMGGQMARGQVGRGLGATPSAADRRRPRDLLSSVPEPTRLLAEPIGVSRDEVRVMRHLGRLESVEWWREPPRAPGSAERRAVDYVKAWWEEGPAYVEIDRATGKMRISGWFD